MVFLWKTLVETFFVQICCLSFPDKGEKRGKWGKNGENYRKKRDFLVYGPNERVTQWYKTKLTMLNCVLNTHYISHIYENYLKLIEKGVKWVIMGKFNDQQSGYFAAELKKKHNRK